MFVGLEFVVLVTVAVVIAAAWRAERPV